MTSVGVDDEAGGGDLIGRVLYQNCASGSNAICGCSDTNCHYDAGQRSCEQYSNTCGGSTQ
ncbi:MAG: hypothetical protein QGI45_07575 [Myxococcota bacterium]|nr:hypothetical protein [Myxococcota bacterium]